MDRWFPRIEIPMTWAQFRQLPQHPAYRYEYLDGVARLTGRPRRYHALRTFADRAPREWHSAGDVRIERLDVSGSPELPQLFADAFAATAPLSLLEPEQRTTAAADCLARTWSGEFGVYVEPASFVAVAGDRLCAAILVTLVQAGDLEAFDDPRWGEPPPAGALEQRWGRPHVTWVLTAPDKGRQGLATALLERSVSALSQLGYRELASTFLLGNEASMLWHWRNGFHLLSYVGSSRRRV